MMNDKSIPSIAVNLADLYLYFSYDPENYAAWLRSTGCSRFYIGSYFCDKYFIKTLMTAGNEICAFASGNGCSVTLVVPVITGKKFRHMSELFLDFLVSQPCVDEVVVNDYAMLDALYEFRETVEKPFKITAGRLFFKNYRDPRYPEHEKSTTVSFFPALLKGKVDAAELDMCTEKMDVSSMPPDTELHLHYPFTYVTCGQYCEFASAINPDRRKFRTDNHCGQVCMNGSILTEAAGAEFLHMGKAVYTPCPDTFDAGREAARYIYWPVRNFMEIEGGAQ